MSEITYADLVAAVSAGRLSEDQIRSYFVLDAATTKAFDPHFRLNYDKVDVAGLEQTAAATGDPLAIEAGRIKQQARRTSRPGNGTYVAEGDSWFRLPPILFPATMADYLAADYPLDNLAHWGDTLAEMVAARQYLPMLKAKTVKVLLISGGGNDLLGDTLERSLKLFDPAHGSPNDAEWYLTEVFHQQLDGVIGNYQKILAQIRMYSPLTKLIAHGYDYARPQENGIFLGVHFARRGLHPLDRPQLCLNIVRAMVDHFNARLKGIAQTDSSFVYVDLRGTVHDDEWYDSELHPKETAARRLAGKMAKALGPAPPVLVADAAAAGFADRTG